MADSKSRLRLSGLSCAVCASKVERGLRALPGVEDAVVNLAASIAVVNHDQGKVSGRELAEAVRQMGYGAEPDVDDGRQGEVRTLLLSVDGMSCAMCAARLEKAVSEADGVLEASVNFASSNLLVHFDSGITGTDAIENVVKDAGYRVISDGGGERAEPDGFLRDAVPAPDVNEADALKGRLVTGIILAIPVFVLSMPGLFPFVKVVSWQVRAVILLGLSALMQFYVGWSFLKNAWIAFRHGGFDMNTLVSAGTLSAFFYSMFVTIFPEFFRDAGLPLHLYFDSVSMIILFVLLGRFLERRARDRAAGAITKLLSLVPSTAMVIREGREVRVPAVSIKPGERIRVGPAEAVPVDGVVIEGVTEVDESMLTGESAPAGKKPGDRVTAGSLNQWGSFVMQAERVGEETVIAGMARVVREAQGSKAAIQRIADRVASIFVPVVITAAVFAGTVWLLVGPEPRITNALVTFVAVMVVACPCAMGLATPAAIMAGTGRGAELGILVKNARAVEQAANISDVVFDKTGTLTLGRPLITDMKITGDYDRGLLLGAAAALEAMSEHPIASAVVRRAEDEGIESLPEITDFRAFPGLGVSGLASVGSGDSRLDVLAGTRDFMEKNSVDTAPAADAAAMFEAEGKTVMWFAITGRVAALFAVSDAIRPEAGEAVQAIHDMGIRVTMLTGDNRATAEAVAQGLGLDGFEAGVLPEGKAAYIKRLQSEGRRVAMVGDGVNDAPALVQADVGIAMSGGTDIAMDAADIGLARADLTYVPGALGLVRATFRVIRQNLFWAFAYNILAIPIAAGILYPLWGVRLSPAVAAAAMAMSSVTVVSNALRLRYWKI